MKKKIVSLVLTSILAISSIGHVNASNSEVCETSSTAISKNGIVVDKTGEIIEGTEDEVKITLESYIEGHINEKAKPIDVLFVLDQSSSMSKSMHEAVLDEDGKPVYDDNGNVITQGNRSRQRVLQDSVIKLLEGIKKANNTEGCDIRVAVTTFHDTAQLLQLGADKKPVAIADQDKSKAFQKGDQYFSDIIKNIDTWNGKKMDVVGKPSTITPSGIGGLKSNTNVPAAFELAKQITDLHKHENRETCVVFYSDGKPQFPDYKDVVMEMPEKVKLLFGNTVTVRDERVIDLTKDLNFTDGRYKGDLSNTYANKIYSLVNSEEPADKELLIKLVELVRGKTLTEQEKETVKYSRLLSSGMAFRKAAQYLLWPRDEVYRYDLHKYNKSVKAANELEKTGVKIYAVSTFDELDEELMTDKDNTGTCTSSHVPKGYICASRMMQLISSNYNSDSCSDMGLQIQEDNKYTVSVDVPVTQPLLVDYYNPITKQIEKSKPLWDTITNGYIVDGDSSAGHIQLDQSTEAAQVKLNHTYNIVKTPTKQAKNYYTNAKTADVLEKALMQSISEFIFGSVSSEAIIDEKSIVTDYLSDDFILDESFTERDVEVYVRDCKGVDADGNYKWGELKKYEEVIAPYKRPTIEIVGNHTIQVKGFDFQEHMITKQARKIVNSNGEIVDEYGRKLVIVFNAKAKNETVWGYQLPTNKPESGIYIPNDPTPVIKFPEPTVDIYRNYSMKDNIVYLGNKMNGNHTLSDKEASMVNGKRNGNVDIRYILEDQLGKKYTNYVPAGMKLEQGKLYEGLDTVKECVLGRFHENAAYTCQRVITVKEDKNHTLDTRTPKENTKAHVAVLKPFLPTTSIWIDNPKSEKIKPNLVEECFGTVSGSTGSKKFTEMKQEDITWSGKNHKGEACTKVTIADLIKPTVTVEEAYAELTNNVYSEKDFNLQLQEGNTNTVFLSGPELAADTSYQAFNNFHVYYNQYAVQIVKEVKKDEASENMSFLFDGIVSSASDENVNSLKPILIREESFADKGGILQGKKMIYGLECKEDVFEVSENTEWSWMYDMTQMKIEDNIKAIYPDSPKLIKNHFVKTTGQNAYKGTFEFEEIQYEASKVPVITVTVRNTQNKETGLYHEHSVANVFENDTITCE